MPPAAPHNALPRVLAFYHYWRKIYDGWGKRINGGRRAAGLAFLIWFGPTQRLTVAEPELVREIFLTRTEAFDRYEAHPVVRQLESDGLVSLHGDNSSCCVFSLDDGGAAATAWWCRRKANLSLPPLRDWPPALTRSRRRQRRDDEDDDSPPVEAFLGTCHGQASRVWGNLAISKNFLPILARKL
uniref:Uncharacterized protein n=1 Tax=Oryza nivara TaxID=4536 RepID=A0A0E0J7S6_ORYNI